MVGYLAEQFHTDFPEFFVAFRVVIVLGVDQAGIGEGLNALDKVELSVLLQSSSFVGWCFEIWGRSCSALSQYIFWFKFHNSVGAIPTEDISTLRYHPYKCSSKISPSDGVFEQGRRFTTMGV